jgi:hypothetical protein
VRLKIFFVCEIAPSVAEDRPVAASHIWDVEIVGEIVTKTVTNLGLSINAPKPPRHL